MSIEQWRAKIDIIEDELIKALNERANYAIEIGKIKKAEGKPVYNKKREDEIFERLANKNTGPLSDEAIQSIFATIIKESRRIQEESEKN